MQKMIKPLTALLLSICLLFGGIPFSPVSILAGENYNATVVSFSDAGRMTGIGSDSKNKFSSANLSISESGQFNLSIPSSTKVPADSYDSYVGGTGYYQMPGVTISGRLQAEDEGGYFGGLAYETDGDIEDYECIDVSCSNHEVKAGRGGGEAGREHVFRISKASAKIEYDKRADKADIKISLSGEYVGLPTEYANWEATDDYSVTYYLEVNSPKIGSSSEPVKEEPEIAGDLVVSGVISDGTGKYMKGVSVQAILFDMDDDTVPPVIVNTKTGIEAGKKGIFKAPFEVKGMKNPSVRITISLDYIGDNDTILINFIDRADKKGSEHMTISTDIPLPDTELEKLKAGQEARLSCCASFAYLSAEEPFFATTDGEILPYTIGLTDSVTVEMGEDVDRVLSAEERIADASVLYSFAQAAHQYTQWTLREKNAMTSQTLKILLRDIEPERQDGAFYRYTDHTIHLGVEVSTRSDDAMYTILHEFGHSVDHVTTENSSYHLYTTRSENNHDGIFNSTMCDSYTEGFATFFAAMIRQSLGCELPMIMTRANLVLSKHNYAYQTSEPGYGYEELSIASFLWNIMGELGNEKNGQPKIWPILSGEHNTFKDIYDEIVSKLGKDKKNTADTMAYTLGLFAMPIAGNGKYDEGEPYQDMNKNHAYDEGEPYYDMIYTWEYDESLGQYFWNGMQDGKSLDMNSLEFGVTADYNRKNALEGFEERFSSSLPETGFLSLEPEDGVKAPYVLVTISREDGTTYTNLFSTLSGRILLFDPRNTGDGVVEVKIPGGNVIYEGEIGKLAKKAHQKNAPKDLDSVVITEDDLPDVDVAYVPAYGNNATGYLIPEAPDADEIEEMIESQEEDSEGIFDTAKTKPADKKNNNSNKNNKEKQGSSGQNENQNSANDEMDDKKPIDGNSYNIVTFLIIGGVIVLLILLILVIVIRKKSKRKKAILPVSPVPLPGSPERKSVFCSNCGSKLAENAAFCTKCGKQIKR